MNGPEGRLELREREAVLGAQRRQPVVELTILRQVPLRQALAAHRQLLGPRILGFVLLGERGGLVLDPVPQRRPQLLQPIAQRL